MRIIVVGLGLIGGSFCKALKKYTDHHVIGVDADPNTLDLAISMEAVDEVIPMNRLDLLRRGDLVIVAIPPKDIVKFILDNKENFQKGAVVTDVCGVKEYIVKNVSEPLREVGVEFIGAHPMAGTEYAGFTFAKENMFVNASYLVTPTEKTDREKLDKLKQLAYRIGFKTVLETTPEDHDKSIAYTSQLAHVVSNSYIRSTTLPREKGFSAGSFLDMTRVARLYEKYAFINTENIAVTDEFVSGQFASYHVYPFQTDLLQYINDFGETEPCYNENGTLNDYRTYFMMLESHHSLPVVISEFGISTGRNVEHEATDREGVYSRVSENEQGKALADCWEDIKLAGLNGGCVYSWQDDWSKRTWNTYYAINEERSPYWSDYQTNGQYFGLLSFDPGEKKSVCYVDGDISEWNEDDNLIKEDIELSVKYDEKFMYFLVKKENLDFSNDIIFIPIDTTQKTGSNYCKEYDAKFDREADFLLVINGIDNTRLLVQERYEALRSTYSQRINGFDTYRKENIPEKISPIFVPINTIVEKKVLSENPLERNIDILIETGKLLYGNANPESQEFNSLADFISAGDYIEIRIPWQLLNFSDPSRMQIHDDYYDGNYGIKNTTISEIYIGAGSKSERIALKKLKLKGWGNKVTYHERLKQSYYIMQRLWKGCE